jgi:hypothetical protein
MTCLLEKIAVGEKAIREAVVKELPDVCKRIEGGEALNDEDRESLERVIAQALDVMPKDK